MKTELQHAVTFLVDTLKDKLPSIAEDKFDTLRTRLTVLLADRYENHWYVDKPLKGSAFRCINISIEDNKIDDVLRNAAYEIGVTENHLLGVFSKGLALWVDPDDVSGRMGKGAIFPIYKKMVNNRTVVSEPAVSGIGHRPQQRPRSISPPQSVITPPDIPSSKPIITSVSRQSKTPPGFRSLDAGQNFYSMPNHNQPPQQQQQNIARSDFPNNIQNLWRTQTTAANNTHNMNMSTSHATVSQMSAPRNSNTVSYMSSQSTNKYNNSGSGDAVYSFNQYSSYYNPYFHWRKDSQQQQSQYNNATNMAQTQQKSMWQDDEAYQRTHWFRDANKSSNNKLSVAGNNLTLNKMQNYAYGISRQAQEVY
jgi:protein Tob/BTG